MGGTNTTEIVKGPVIKGFRGSGFRVPGLFIDVYKPLLEPLHYGYVTFYIGVEVKGSTPGLTLRRLVKEDFHGGWCGSPKGLYTYLIKRGHEV